MDELEIRPESTTDYQAVYALHEAAFGGEVESRLVHALREHSLATISLVAIQNQKLVGHILFSPVTVKGEKGSAEKELLSLAPMSVYPDFQNRGIGTRLVEVGLAACESIQAEAVVVLGHPSFYSRLGFRADLAAELENPFGGGEAWMAIGFPNERLKDLRGIIVYPAPFDAL